MLLLIIALDRVGGGGTADGPCWCWRYCWWWRMAVPLEILLGRDGCDGLWQLKITAPIAQQDQLSVRHVAVRRLDQPSI